jgi:hypothetical protein
LREGTGRVVFLVTDLDIHLCPSKKGGQLIALSSGRGRTQWGKIFGSFLAIVTFVIKQSLNRVSPKLFMFVQVRYRRLRFRFLNQGRNFRAKQALCRRFGKRVLAGPFQEMKYPYDVVMSSCVPKLVGSYEEELHSVINEIIRRRYSMVVNVGCAEGYYAVGLALRMPDAIVYAFDTDPIAQHYCTNLAKLNSVFERVRVKGFCSHGDLQQLSGRDSVILCDCEGFELELLDPAAVPQLASTDILVELHEFIKPGVTDTISSRFRDTHWVTLMDTRDRDPESYPILGNMAPAARYSVLSENRPAAMQWAYLRSKGRR